MFEAAWILLASGFLTLFAFESNRVLTESTRLRRRIIEDSREPARAGRFIST